MTPRPVRLGVAFLDLLSCALASVLILYNVLPSEEAPAKADPLTSVRIVVDPELPLRDMITPVALLHVAGQSSHSEGSHSAARWFRSRGSLTAILPVPSNGVLEGLVAIGEAPLASLPDSVLLLIRIMPAGQQHTVFLRARDAYRGGF